MDFTLIWQTIFTFIFGIVALRVAGRKSLAQTTVAETVVMIAVGTVLIEPLVGKDIWRTFGAVIVIISTLYLLEYVQLKWPLLERVFTGKAVIVIEDGQLQPDNLRKLRMTVEQLEIYLRQASVTRIAEVKYATIEPNGQLGFILNESAEPLTKADYQRLMDKLEDIERVLRGTAEPNRQRPVGVKQPADNLFSAAKAQAKIDTPSTPEA